MNGIQVVTGGLQRALRPTNIHRLEEIMCVYVCVCVCVPAGPPVHMEHLVRRYAARQQWPERRTVGPVCPCE